jgi:4-hydroxy-3-polyprenylbenzoate decarboxylase
VLGYSGLRDWIEQVDALGELRRLSGASWDLEIGAISEIVAREMENGPALLFDDIPGYPAGHRVLSNYFGSVGRVALTVGFPADLDGIGFVQRWREHTRGLQPIAPRVVQRGPVLDHVRTSGIDLGQFPVPRWHEHDGGRYIGTACSVITRDRDTGWVNSGTYRVQLLGNDRLGLFMAPGRHGMRHRVQYWSNGEPCPVAMVFGGDPLLYMASSSPIPFGTSEYDVAGGISGRPFDVVNGPVTGLPIPADAEIVIEGEMAPGDESLEGPFGEFTGYYGGGEKLAPLIRVQSLLHRDDPILGGSVPARPPNDTTLLIVLMRAAMLWNQIEAAGVPDVRGVWLQYPGSNYFSVVSISQRYAGHAKQAAIIASQCAAAAVFGKWVVVVDDDIDPTNIKDVLWAMSTRCDPERDVEIQRDSWSHRLDPMAVDDLSSKVIVNACKPFKRLRDFPRTAEVSPELRRQVLDKWDAVLRGADARARELDLSAR